MKVGRLAINLRGKTKRKYRGGDRLHQIAQIGGYLDAMPSPKNAVDLIPGWNHVLPSEAGVEGGQAVLYNDARIRWFIEQFGNIEGKKILELGPLEGSHTYMFDRGGASSVLAIEANKLSFLRCLVAKNLLNLNNSHFMLGNFVKWLEATEDVYDVIVACGVLYHMSDPLHLLDLMAARSDAIFLWTHYFDEEAMPEGDLRRVPISGAITREFRGMPVKMYTRRYFGAQQDSAFCGGINDTHYWLERDTIIAVLRTLGFDDLRVGHDEPGHPNGPSFCLFARRSGQPT